LNVKQFLLFLAQSFTIGGQQRSLAFSLSVDMDRQSLFAIALKTYFIGQIFQPTQT